MYAARHLFIAFKMKLPFVAVLLPFSKKCLVAKANTALQFLLCYGLTPVFLIRL